VLRAGAGFAGVAAGLGRVFPRALAQGTPVAEAGLVAFQSIDLTSTAVFLATPGEPSAAQILPGAIIGGKHPDWSPNGESLVMATTRDGLILYDLASDSAAPLDVAVAPDIVLEDPAFSPDGTSVAFTRYEVDPARDAPLASSIVIYELETGQSRDVVRLEFPTFVNVPRWAPDGVSLAVGVEVIDEAFNDKGSAIGVVPAAGGEIAFLTEFDQFAFRPDWNHATGEIMYGVETIQYSMNPSAFPSWDLFGMQADGSATRQITTLPEGEFLSVASWTPDGGAIIATHGLDALQRTVLIDPDTGEYSFLWELGSVPFQGRARLQP